MKTSHTVRLPAAVTTVVLGLALALVPACGAPGSQDAARQGETAVVVKGAFDADEAVGGDHTAARDWPGARPRGPTRLPGAA
ncbi:MAG: hypothetical protein ACREMV_08570 [Gemmatimonadales bacterium]